MSLFDNMKTGEVLDRSHLHFQDTQIKKKQKKTKKQLTEKEIMAQKKEELSEEEYFKWIRRYWYYRNKEHVAKKYQVEKHEKEEILEECWSMLDEMYPAQTSIDEQYLAEYLKDGKNSQGRVRYSWWGSNLVVANRKPLKTIVEIMKDGRINRIYNMWMKEQDKAYKYIMDNYEMFSKYPIWMAKKQTLTARPMRSIHEELQPLVYSSWISKAILWNLSLWMTIGKFVCSELYVWETYICWDWIMTGMWHLLFPHINWQLKYLTSDTYKEIHKQTQLFLKDGNNPPPPIYRWWCSIFKFENEYEEKFYLVPR